MSKFLIYLVMIVLLFLGVAVLVPRPQADAQGQETWTVETCANMQIITQKSGDNQVIGKTMYCVNSLAPPYPEGTTKKPPESPSETYDVGKPQ